MRGVLKKISYFVLALFFICVIFTNNFLQVANASTFTYCDLYFGSDSEFIGDTRSFKSGQKIYVTSDNITYEDVKSSSLTQGDYYLTVARHGSLVRESVSIPIESLQNGNLSPIDLTEVFERIPDYKDVKGTFTVALVRNTGGISSHTEVCSKVVSYTDLSTASTYSCENIKVVTARSGNLIHVVVAMNTDSLNPDLSYGFSFRDEGRDNFYNIPNLTDTGNGTLRGVISINNLGDGKYNLAANTSQITADTSIWNPRAWTEGLPNHTKCRTDFTVTKQGLKTIEPDELDDLNVLPIEGGGTVTASPYNLCQQISPYNGSEKRQQCEDCFSQDPKGVWTALGCIQTDPQNIIKEFITIGLSIAGGVSILMILGAGFSLSTSQGDPKKTSEAREQITSAVIGLLFIIFSITILQFIGVSILRIPGFGG